MSVREHMVNNLNYLSNIIKLRNINIIKRMNKNENADLCVKYKDEINSCKKVVNLKMYCMRGNQLKIN